MPRPSFFITAFHKRFSGLRKIRIPPKFDFFIGFIFTVYFWSFIVFTCLPVAISDGSELPAGWLSWKYPNPLSNPDECGWTDIVTWAGDLTRNISWICDPDHVLGYSEAYHLALKLNACHRDSQCDCPSNCSHGGYRIAVALVDRLNTDGDFEPMKTKAKKFAQDVRVTWFDGLGCDDNVLIFYSLYDDELYISLGERVERVISDIELVRLNRVGDRALVGKIVSTPSPQAGAVQLNNSFTIVPTTSITDIGQRKTTTGDGIDKLVDAVHVAIINGPSVSSKLVYGAAVPVLLVLIILIMCLLANWCCRPVYGYHQPAQITNKKKEKEEEEEEEEEKEKV